TYTAQDFINEDGTLNQSNIWVLDKLLEALGEPTDSSSGSIPGVEIPPIYADSRQVIPDIEGPIIGVFDDWINPDPGEFGPGIPDKGDIDPLPDDFTTTPFDGFDKTIKKDLVGADALTKDLGVGVDTIIQGGDLATKTMDFAKVAVEGVGVKGVEGVTQEAMPLSAGVTADKAGAKALITSIDTKVAQIGDFKVGRDDQEIISFDVEEDMSTDIKAKPDGIGVKNIEGFSKTLGVTSDFKAFNVVKNLPQNTKTCSMNMGQGERPLMNCVGVGVNAMFPTQVVLMNNVLSVSTFKVTSQPKPVISQVSHSQAYSGVGSMIPDKPGDIKDFTFHEEVNSGTIQVTSHDYEYDESGTEIIADTQTTVSCSVKECGRFDYFDPKTGKMVVNVNETYGNVETKDGRIVHTQRTICTGNSVTIEEKHLINNELLT
ncbi:hypothetical protein BVX93_00330, partial [bacterium B13(2017)]